jgi:hypothetical protein
MIPEELSGTFFLKFTNAVAMVANRGEATCSSGRTHDFIVAHSGIANAIINIKTIPAPWKTHAVIEFQVLRAPRSVHARYLVKPRRLVSEASHDTIDAKSNYQLPQRTGSPGTSQVEWATTPLHFLRPYAAVHESKYAEWSANAEL